MTGEAAKVEVEDEQPTAAAAAAGQQTRVIQSRDCFCSLNGFCSEKDDTKLVAFTLSESFFSFSCFKGVFSSFFSSSLLFENKNHTQT